MNTVALTSEQRAALKLTRESNTAFYDHEQTLVDVQTGEILTSHRETIQKTSGEPDLSLIHSFLDATYGTNLLAHDASIEKQQWRTIVAP